MNLNPKIKKRIDSMDYEQMLRKWRNDPVGIEYFQGEVGDYFAQRMGTLKAKLSPGEQVSASKAVGW